MYMYSDSVHVQLYINLLEVTREWHVQEDLVHVNVYLHTCLAIPQAITWCKAYQNLVLNGRGPLKLLHLYGNFAITSNSSYMPVCALQL